MNQTLQKIDEIKKHGYHLDLGETITQTFENYKKIALLAGAVLLLMVILLGIIVGGGVGLIFGAASLTESFTDISTTGTSSSMMLMLLVGSVIGYALIAPLYAGIIQMAHNAEIGDDFDFGTAFTHYKSTHFKNIFLATALITLFTAGISTVLDLVHLYSGDPTAPNLLSLIGALINILTSIFTVLTVPAIIFGNLNATQAIGASITLVTKKFWVILLLLIIFGIFSAIGVIALCIGVFFTLPVIYSLQYIIYRNAIPMEDKNELDEIGETIY